MKNNEVEDHVDIKIESEEPPNDSNHVNSNSNDSNSNDSNSDDSSAVSSIDLQNSTPQTNTGAADSGTRPLVEWIYPDGYESPNEEAEETVRSERTETEPAPFVVDPNDVYVELEVEGRVVEPRRYFLKIFGFVLCNDEIPTLINPKVLPLIFLLVICVIILGIYFPSRSSSNSFEANQVTMQPSATPSNIPSLAPVDPRVANITDIIHGISGDVALIDGSSQNKALTWLLYDDPMRLTSSNSNIVQRYILMLFFYALLGENWTFSSWGSGEDECTWFGISCSSTGNQRTIVGIRLEGRNLKGTIPSEIGELTGLKRLNVVENDIKGSIPSEIGKMDDLEQLRMSGNSLTGTIPTMLHELKALQALLLDDNSLNGTIPTILGRLKSLVNLQLQNNQLFGTIPSEIGNMKALQVLRINSMDMSGTIPPELGQIPSLSMLILRMNNLVGTIPSTFEQLDGMEHFDLSANFLIGSIPSYIFNLPRIEVILLTRNKLTGTIPEFSLSSSNLRHIHIGENDINGTIPESFGGFAQLEQMTLHITNLTGSMPEGVCNLSLKSLSADCAAENMKVSCACCTICF